jgi:hypothetical protein
MAEVEKLQDKMSMYKAHLPLGKLFSSASWLDGGAALL